MTFFVYLTLQKFCLLPFLLSTIDHCCLKAVLLPIYFLQIGKSLSVSLWWFETFWPTALISTTKKCTNYKLGAVDCIRSQGSGGSSSALGTKPTGWLRASHDVSLNLGRRYWQAASDNVAKKTAGDLFLQYQESGWLDGLWQQLFQWKLYSSRFCTFALFKPFVCLHLIHILHVCFFHTFYTFCWWPFFPLHGN